MAAPAAALAGLARVYYYFNDRDSDTLIFHCEKNIFVIFYSF
jgi:hypothetical protein